MLSKLDWINRIHSVVRSFPRMGITANQAQVIESLCQDISSTEKFNTLSKSVPQKLPSSEIYANNYLNFEQLKVIGFDLDYTLVTYTDEVQKLIYDTAKDILVDSYGFPASLKESKFDKNFPIRGLAVDKDNGILCKLSHLQRVSLNATYKGKKQLSVEEADKLYGESRHIPYTQFQKLRVLHDLFSIVEASLITDSIEHFEHRKQFHGELYSPSAVMEDIETAIREVHISGNMHTKIVNDLPRYVSPNRNLPKLFDHIRSCDKAMFLCTNSPFRFANKLMCYMMGLPDSDPKASETWRENFDVVICTASKPDFYKKHNPFRLWNIEQRSASPIPVKNLEKGSVYVHGSCYALHRAKGWEGREILYVGDNLHADLREARRWHGWHTACVIHELEQEIDVQHSDEFQQLYYFRSLLRQFIQEFQSLSRNELASREYASSAEFGDYLTRVEVELRNVNGAMSDLFNERFGSIFRTDGHPSLFAFAIKRYSDLYMSDVCNFKSYGKNHRFYPKQGIHMDHVPKYESKELL